MAVKDPAGSRRMRESAAENAMTKFAMTMTIALALPALAVGAVRSYGRPLAGLPKTSLADVLAHPEAGKAVRLDGRVERVCQNKGCWLTLADGDKSVHVTFEGYSFFVPKDSSGSRVRLEGRVVVKQPKPEDVEHLRSEGAGAAQASNVSIEATGVELATD
jgi:Domain of unknown function (DUF4920)